MKLVIQRVNSASVTVDGNVTGAIGKGFLVLFGAGKGDTAADAERLAAKMTSLRIFSDENGKINLTEGDTFTFTTEDVVGTNEKMRHYDSIEECVEDYANIVYLCHPELKGDNNIWDYDRFLKHYTPNPKEPVVYKYARIIKDYNLEQYDE